MVDYIKTIFLLSLLSIAVIFISGLIGGRDGLYTGLLISLLLNAGAYFFSDKLALSSSGAKPMDRSQFPHIHQVVEELSQLMQIPMPKLYIIPTSQANAFATGRDPRHASVAVTEGILKVLSTEELKAVLAHELGHVKNRDILIASIAAVLASTIVFVSRMGMYGGFSNDSDEDHSSSGVGILLALLAPVAATIVQMAVSREREYEADETAAETLHSGDSLASALIKIHQSTAIQPQPNLNPAFAPLYIANPFGGLGGSLLNLFSTHPPVEERIKRLQSQRFSQHA